MRTLAWRGARALRRALAAAGALGGVGYVYGNVLLAPGTAALEAMLAKRPMVVGYRVSALTAWIVRAFGLMRTERYALPNVLAGESVVPDLVQ